MCPAQHVKINWFYPPHTLKVLNILYIPQIWPQFDHRLIKDMARASPKV